MHQGKLVFAQLMLYLPLSTFRRYVADHNGEHKVKDFSYLDQFFAMAFAQLTYRESLRDIEVNLGAQARRLYPYGQKIHPSQFPDQHRRFNNCRQPLTQQLSPAQAAAPGEHNPNALPLTVAGYKETECGPAFGIF